MDDISFWTIIGISKHMRIEMRLLWHWPMVAMSVSGTTFDDCKIGCSYPNCLKTRSGRWWWTISSILMKPKNIQIARCEQVIQCDPYGTLITPSYVKASNYASTSCRLEICLPITKHVFLLQNMWLEVQSHHN